MSAPQSVQKMVLKSNQLGGSGVHSTSKVQCLLLIGHPFSDRPILRKKCSMPLDISKTTKAYLFAGKYTFSYSPLVLWWPRLSHYKGKEGILLDLPMVSTCF